MATLISNIKKLVNTRTSNELLKGKELGSLSNINDAYLIIEGDVIAEYGKMKDDLYEFKEF